ncbi:MULTISPECIES: glycohydrolase toxin TNT-related protein [unclassified Actinotalea]|uniref:glycohydrolase toxin TNT-related protein n=1 Tax=unclassified Actinotalea TaxID=2638618 RepID=UPI0015F4125E|nr:MULTISPECIES: glycohydrolase toxin TNT-related protein [unclassified Actinotalea]
MTAIVQSGRLTVERSDIAPWFGQQGGGMQYRFFSPTGKELSQGDLIGLGVIRKVGSRTMVDQPQAPPEFVALRAEGEARGFVYGMDFFVWGVPGNGSSESIIFGCEGADYTVTYSDMGRERRLYASASYDDAKRRFFDEVARLAGPRGRGPLAGKPAQTGYEGMTQEQVYEQLKRQGYF